MQYFIVIVIRLMQSIVLIYYPFYFFTFITLCVVSKVFSCILLGASGSKVYQNMDESTSYWRLEDQHSYDDCTAETSLNSSNQSQLGMINTLVNTNDVLTKELESKSQKIEALELRVKELEAENTRLQRETMVNSNSTNNQKVDKELSATIKIAYPQFHVKFNLAEPYSSQNNNMVKAELLKRLQETHPDKSAKLMNIAIRSRYSLERRREKEKSDDTRDHDKERRQSARRHDAFLGRRKVSKERSLHEDLMKEMTADDMSDLESGEEDGQMVLRKKRPIWRTPTKTAAFASLDEFRNIEKKRVEASPSLRSRKQK